MKVLKRADNIFHLKDIYQPEYFVGLVEEFDPRLTGGWIFSKRESKTAPYFGETKDTANNGIGINLKLIDAATIAKLHVEHIVKQRLTLTRVNTNIQFFGQDSEFHIDNGDCGIPGWTFLVFADTGWNTEWGGEFTICDSSGNYHSIPFIPNCGALFPVHYEHRGLAPNRLCLKERKSLAFMFQ